MSKSRMPPISIVVLSYNRADVIGRNLEAIFALPNCDEFEVIIVDNCSTDDSKSVIERIVYQRKNVNFIINSDNLGVAGGRNVGWRVARNPFVLTIDDDTIISLEAIVELSNCLVRRSDVGIVSPRILHAKTMKPQFAFDSERSIANFHGACHLVRAELFRMVGWNDEACSFGGEELDYSIRTRSFHFDVVYVPTATVLHDSFLRSEPESKDRRLRWTYNFIRVFFKNFPLNFACLLSFRFIMSHVIAGRKDFGFSFPLLVIRSAISGAQDGHRRRSTVRSEVVAFYRDKNLRPEYGNVSLCTKVSRVLFKRLRNKVRLLIRWRRNSE